MKVYWYISKAKLDVLRGQSPAFLDGISTKINFKFPFLSGSLSGTERSKLVPDLRRVIKALESRYKIKSFDELGANEAPVLFRFEGPSLKSVLDDVFWLTTYGSHTALLLTGSAGFAIGATQESEVKLSPSADPISAVKAAFGKRYNSKTATFGRTRMRLSTSLSYVWQELMRSGDESSGILPKARGLAIFARALDADKAQMRRVGKSELKKLVIGTPLYVEQV